MTIADYNPGLGDPLPVGGTAMQVRMAEAAIELFYQHGAVATTVRDITAACGLTPGALYNHYASKDHLLYLVVRDIHRQVNVAIAAVIAAAGDDPAARLIAAVSFLVSHTAGFKKRSRVANREFTLLTGSRRQEITTIRRQMRDQFAAILLDGARRGTFRLVGGDDEAAATMTAATITTMCVRISESTLENFPLSTADLQGYFAELALRAAGAAIAR
jgi:TetR/AcrR family transcriptional regulator, cholesterol catabolism regulator